MLHRIIKIVPCNIFLFIVSIVQFVRNCSFSSSYSRHENLEGYSAGLETGNLQAAHLYGAAVRVDAPAVALNAVDAVGVAAHIVDIHRADAVVGGDDDVVSVVGGALEHITVVVGKESATLLTLLLKVDLAGVVALVVDDERVEHVGIGAAHQRDSELVAVAAGLHRKLDAVLVSQTREERPCVARELEV